MKLKSILQWVPPFDFIIDHHEIYAEFKELEATDFYGKTGLDLVELREKMAPKLGRVFGKKGEEVRQIYKTLDDKAFEENLDEYESAAMHALYEDLNNERTRYGNYLIAHRKVSKPNPTDWIMTSVVHPVQTYNKIKESNVYKSLKSKGRKTLEFFSEFGRRSL